MALITSLLKSDQTPKRVLMPGESWKRYWSAAFKEACSSCDNREREREQTQQAYFHQIQRWGKNPLMWVVTRAEREEKVWCLVTVKVTGDMVTCRQIQRLKHTGEVKEVVLMKQMSCLRDLLLFKYKCRMILSFIIIHIKRKECLKCTTVNTPLNFTRSI